MSETTQSYQPEPVRKKPFFLKESVHNDAERSAKWWHHVASLPYRRFWIGAGCLLTVLFSIFFVDVLQHFGLSCGTAKSALSTGSPAFDPEWYRKTIFYEIYPASFQDSDGDGVGDINGITSRLQHLVDIGAGTVWLTPIFESPMLDAGYDISNFTAINPLFGTLDDFRALMAKVKQLGLRLIIDLVPNHSSNECEWFYKSRHRIDPYTDYYVWHPGNPDVRLNIDGKKRNGIPNNWPSVFDGPSWEFDELRQEYYYHAFLPEQPDLNYWSEALRAEMKNVLKFWFDLGVDGFRVDAYNFAYESKDLLNNNATAWDPNSDDAKNSVYWGFQHDLLQQELPETFENLVDWRAFVDEYAKVNNRDHMFLVTECVEGDVTISMQYDTYKGRKAADFTFNFAFINVTNTTNAHDIARIVQVWLDFLPEKSWPNWVVGNHDTHRAADRFGGRHLIDGLNMLILLLPGTPFTYYGEEIGMVNYNSITIEQIKDRNGLTPEHIGEWRRFARDFQRTPMQWKNVRPNADFTSPSVTPYLPVNQDNLATINVEDQTGKNNTHLTVYKQLAALRREPAFSDNKALKFVFVDNGTLAFVRQSLTASAKYVVVIDLRREADGPVNIVNLRSNATLVTEFAMVEIADVNLLSATGLQKGVIVPTNAVPLAPGGALVMKL